MQQGHDYVYFWRWALWRLFEKQTCGGLVTFITASSYLAGPGFVGVREVMRRTFDELWIIDLGGDNLGTRKTPNVFNIQNPVAIAIGVRAAQPNPDTPARVRYAKIDGATREAKLTQLDGIGTFAGLAWRDCQDDWHKPLLPAGKGDFFEWPPVTQLFPWQHSGCELKRSWPISESTDVLARRWERLVSAKDDEKDRLIRRTDARNKGKTVDALLGNTKLTPISDLKKGDNPEAVVPYSYRSFDRQFVILDGRLGDRFRPPLIEVRSDKQVFMTSLQSHPLGEGPGMVCATYVPDRHVFRGSYSGKDVIPLYRDAAGAEPNVTGGLLTALAKDHGSVPSAEDLAAYVYALLGGQSYTKRFWNELETPGPRVPITKDGAVFADAVKLGRKLIWLHTYASRFQEATKGDEVPNGKATTIKGVSSAPAQYPADYGYDATKCEITVGDGRFGPVAPEVWDFEVSGLKVVQSWLGYRMKKRAGKKSSPLDEIRPERWTARMSDEFLELLWVLEATLAMEPDLAKILEKVVSGRCFVASDLPQPTAAERKAPCAEAPAGDLLALMEDDGDTDDDDEDEA